MSNVNNMIAFFVFLIKISKIDNKVKVVFLVFFSNVLSSFFSFLYGMVAVILLVVNKNNTPLLLEPQPGSNSPNQVNQKKLSILIRVCLSALFFFRFVFRAAEELHMKKR